MTGKKASPTTFEQAASLAWTEAKEVISLADDRLDSSIFASQKSTKYRFRHPAAI